MTKKFIPAISIIIPMYNAEKFIGECLESILAQTFQDFEIILVDDCSTDSTCEIVENYISENKNRIRLIRRKINSGLPSIPSNIGLKISRGEYVFFMDNDDTIIPTALEELYNVAEKFHADFVTCEKFYQTDFEGKNIKIHSYQEGKFVEKPTSVSEDFSERIAELYDYKFLWSLWVKLIRRDFLMEENIEFVNVMGQDLLLTVCMICSAKKIVRVPNIIYNWRMSDKSISHEPKNFKIVFRQWTRSLVEGISYLDKFLDRQEIFKQRIDLKYGIFEIVTRNFLRLLLPFYSKMPANQLDEFIRAEFSKSLDTTALSTFIFSRMNKFNVRLMEQMQK